MQHSSFVLPRPFAFAIDDMGWLDGRSGAIDGEQGPYRLGIERRMTINDYLAVIDVGKAVGVRIQGLFILCEMDRENVCAEFPTTTMQGLAWDNARNIGDLQRDIMRLLDENAAYLEFGLHGIGHEFWPKPGKRVRSEWYDIQGDKPWPEESLRGHLECFRKILAQYGTGKDSAHSFPKSFVPCAYGYYWNPSGDYSLGKLLAENGVKYANTLFAEIGELNPPSGDNGGGFDHGVHVVNRLNYGNEWFAYASLPTVPIQDQTSDMAETHWANWLASDPADQLSVTARFIEYYRGVQRSANRYAAKNTAQFHSQWLYCQFALVDILPDGTVRIDNTRMPAEAYESGIAGNLALKVALAPGIHVSAASIESDGATLFPAAYFEDEGFGFVYLPPLERRVYLMKCEFSQSMPTGCVWNDGTYSALQCRSCGGTITVELELYGTQTVKVLCPEPAAVEAKEGKLSVRRWRYDEEKALLEIDIAAPDMQGSRGSIDIRLTPP